jgi:hypothetical protein
MPASSRATQISPSPKTRPAIFRYTVLKMKGRWREERRYAFVVLLLCLFLVAQAAAFASVNREHHSQDHCCLLCHVGPLPFLHTHVSAVVAPAFCMVWLESAPDSIPTHDVLISTSSSRAPPA